MSIRPVSRVFLHALSWTILCGAFVVAGARQSWPVLAMGGVRPVQPFDSTDCYIERFIPGEGGSERILQALENTPRDKQIALILPNADEESAFVAQIITYLSWPRDVQWITTARQLQALDQDKVAAFVFWGITPPNWLPQGIRIGPRQTIVRAPQAGSNRR